MEILLKNDAILYISLFLEVEFFWPYIVFSIGNDSS